MATEKLAKITFANVSTCSCLRNWFLWLNLHFSVKECNKMFFFLKKKAFLGVKLKMASIILTKFNEFS